MIMWVYLVLATGTIKDITLDSVDITGNNQVGGLVGYNYQGTIDNNIAIGSVDGNEDIGGLVGYNFQGTIDDSIANGSVVGNNNNAGGLVGLNDGTIENSTANGSVDSNDNVGGLVGYNEDGTIENSTANGSVVGDNIVGGLVGYNDSGTYSEGTYCQQDSSLPAVGNSEYIPGITTYDANCEVILISTTYELQAINDNLSESYRLVKDIDLSGIDFTPIGGCAKSFF